VPVDVPEVGVGAKVRGSYPKGFACRALLIEGSERPAIPSRLRRSSALGLPCLSIHGSRGTSWGRGSGRWRFEKTEAGSCVGLFCGFSVGASKTVPDFVEDLDV
jgi:hypothetical protein